MPLAEFQHGSVAGAGIHEQHKGAIRLQARGRRADKTGTKVLQPAAAGGKVLHFISQVIDAALGMRLQETTCCTFSGKRFDQFDRGAAGFDIGQAVWQAQDLEGFPNRMA